MQDLDRDEVKFIYGGTANVEKDIPPRFRRLIEAMEDFASLPKELLAHRESR